MTPAFKIVAPWIFIIVVAAIGFVVSFSRHRELRLPRAYLLYFAVAGTAQLIIWYWYPDLFVYYPFEFANTILLCSMAIELLYVLESAGFVTLLVILGLAEVAFRMADVRPPDTTITTNLEVGLKAVIIGAITLSARFLHRRDWTRETRRVSWGILLLLALSVASSLKSLLEWFGEWGVLFFQVSPLPGLIYLIFAGAKNAPQRSLDPPARIVISGKGRDPIFRNKLHPY